MYWSVVKVGLRRLAIGIAISVPTTIALAKILQNRIWGISSGDALTLLAVSLVLTVVALIACYVPARRATKVDPMVAVRYEIAAVCHGRQAPSAGLPRRIWMLDNVDR